ncbi:MAG: dephospho-CoA kinase [Candidatus Omnitrophota bacterium]|nr:dephospho-CoA kinase [Candidatus Omnitrophota bacterium]
MQRRFQNKKKLPLRFKAGQSFIIGLTGGFGAGKTTVAGIFKSLGAAVIDADKIAHGLIDPAFFKKKAGSIQAKQGIYREDGYKKIISAFGKDILDENGVLDRPRLGKIVFSSRKLLKKLNRIIHPQVIRIIRKEIKHALPKLIVIDAPLLIESGINKIADILIVVKASQGKQIKRIQKRSSLSRQNILRRIKCQIPLRDKLRLADFIIDNNGSLKKTKKQVKEVWRRLWKS